MKEAVSLIFKDLQGKTRGAIPFRLFIRASSGPEFTYDSQ